MRRPRSPSQRLPRHLGFIPDGNRRWAKLRGLDPGDGYAYGIEPGLRMLAGCRGLGVEEVSIYGFTQENVRRPPDQVERFREACVGFAERAMESGCALLVVGDSHSPSFPRALAGLTKERSPGELRVNLLVNYGWRWDIAAGFDVLGGRSVGRATLFQKLGSGTIPAIDLVLRWGGRCRLSGFLPLQCAYADFYGVDTLWPDAEPSDLEQALEWYQEQDVTLGG